MNIATTKFKVIPGLGWGHYKFNKKANEFAYELCCRVKQEGKDCLALLMELSNNDIPFNITSKVWTGCYEGEIFRNKVVRINVGSEGTELWVFCK